MDDDGYLFLIASALGLTATVLTLVFLRRAGRGGAPPDLESRVAKRSAYPD
jgi:hypothetical protein